MLRLRFLPGLILGLVLGLPAGVLIGMLTLSPRGTAEPTAASLQVQELTRKLEAATEAKERAERQFAQFQKLAEQMTASFNDLERRFNAMEEEQRQRALQAAQTAPRPAGAPSPPQTAIPAPPRPADTPAPSDAQEPEGQAERPPPAVRAPGGEAAAPDPAPPEQLQ